MNRDAIYSGNLSVLLAIIVFLGLSSEMFAGSASTFMKELFKESAIILFAITTCCAISLASLITGELKVSKKGVMKFIEGTAYWFFVIQMILLIIFTYKIILFFMTRV